MAIKYTSDNYITNLLIKFKNDFNMSAVKIGRLFGLSENSCGSCMSHYLNGRLSVSNKKLKVLGIDVNADKLKDYVITELIKNKNTDLLVEFYNKLYYDNKKDL